MDDVDGGHVCDAEAAVHHHQLVQEGAGLLLQAEVDQGSVGGRHQHRGHPPQHLGHIICEQVAFAIHSRHLCLSSSTGYTVFDLVVIVLLPLLQEGQDS